MLFISAFVFVCCISLYVFIFFFDATITWWIKIIYITTLISQSVLYNTNGQSKNRKICMKGKFRMSSTPRGLRFWGYMGFCWNSHRYIFGGYGWNGYGDKNPIPCLPWSGFILRALLNKGNGDLAMLTASATQ